MLTPTFTPTTELFFERFSEFKQLKKNIVYKAKMDDKEVVLKKLADVGEVTLPLPAIIQDLYPDYVKGHCTITPGAADTPIPAGEYYVYEYYGDSLIRVCPARESDLSQSLTAHVYLTKPKEQVMSCWLALRAMQEVARLHATGHTHNDIKPQNFAVRSMGKNPEEKDLPPEVKLIDLEEISPENTTLRSCTARKYWNPQDPRSKSATQENDLYGLAYTLISIARPYYACKILDSIYKIVVEGQTYKAELTDIELAEVEKRSNPLFEAAPKRAPFYYQLLLDCARMLAGTIEKPADSSADTFAYCLALMQMGTLMLTNFYNDPLNLSSSPLMWASYRDDPKKPAADAGAGTASNPTA